MKNRLNKTIGKNSVIKKNRLFEFIFQKYFVLCIVSVVALTILLSPRADFFIDSNLVEGQVCTKNIWAPRDLSIEDTKTTEKKKKDILEKTPSIFDFDEKSYDEISRKVTSAFSQLRTLFNKLLEIQIHIQSETSQEEKEELATNAIKEGTSLPSPVKSFNVDELRAKSIEKIKVEMEGILVSEFGINLPANPEILQFFIRENMSNALLDIINKVFASILKRKVVSNKSSILQDIEKGIQLNYLHSNKQIRLKSGEGYNILDLNDAVAEVDAMIANLNLQQSDTESLAGFIKSHLRPNLTFNKSETEKAKKLAIAKVEPVFFTIKKGEMIIRERQAVTADHILILNSIKKKFDFYNYISRIAGLALIVFMIFSMAFLLLNELSKIFRRNFKHHVIFSVVIIFYIVLSKAQIWLSNSIADSVQSESFQNLSSYFYLLPISIAPILVTLLIDFPSGIIMVFLSSVLTGILPSSHPDLIILGFIAGLAGCFWIERYDSRTGIIKTGLIVGFLSTIFVFFSSMQQPEATELNTTIFNMGCGFSGGLLSAIITLVALPALEQIFNVTTNIKLLELSDTNNPILKKLVVNSPGTFSHTMRVAELSEAAAQEINANHILARVAALYHDIGKVHKSNYFVENFSFNEKNPHDKLNPNMSKTIILSHVKEGVEIAEEYNLPGSIIDAITQHHGTGLISVFYQKAQELAKEKEVTVVEGDFRYPGPKPQNKEMAIIMLADGIEAASRTLVEPTPSSIKAFIDKIFERVIVDGQMDECSLTLRELARIKEVFIKRITTGFHQRLDYPGVVFEGKKKRDRSNGQKQSENGGMQNTKDKENGTKSSEPDES